MSTRKNILAKSISAKLITIFLVISLIPIAIIGFLSVKNASDSLIEREFEHLQSVGDFKVEKINEYLNNLFIPLDVLTKSGDIKIAYNSLKSYHDLGGVTQNGEFDISSNRYKEIYNQVDPFFKVFIESFGFDDLYFICAEHGHVMYSSRQESDLGTNLSNGLFKDSNLADLWNRVRLTGKSTMVDFEIYGASGQPECFIGAPLKDDKGNVIAVLALEIVSDSLNEIMRDDHGLGQTGETFLVGKDKLLRSDLKFENESTILKKRVDTENVNLGLQSNTGVHTTVNYNDTKVLSYYTHLSIDKQFGADFDWALVTELSSEEALKPANSLKSEIMIISLIIAILVVVIAFFVSRLFSKPIQMISSIAKSAAIGDFTQKVTVSGSDEIGILAESFASLQSTMKSKAEQAIAISKGDLTIEVTPLSEKDEMGKAFKIMVENLNQQINDINRVVSTLTSSNSQLMSTIAQLSSSSNETATTVSEVTTTIEEVKQTAEVTTQKAKNVSSVAQKSLQYSENGIKATEESLEGMHHIRDQVKSIAETIIKLSEQSQTIGEITNTVNDLAEQSNLLAVNASIEAVKAGEYGKGFGVVAQEIRALADQSKQSTYQIKNILNEVQKAVSSAVMATEQGGKAVDSGLSLAEASGESISMLADSISEAASASVQIATSSNQQLTGMEQLTLAMENIKLAASQNASGAKQAEEAVANIKNIVQNLTNLINNYKTK